MDLHIIALRSGIHISKIKEAYETALQEASFIGVKSEKFIYETMEEILDMNEKSLSSRYSESGIKDFDQFLESLLDEKEISEDLMSTNFAPSQKPEGGSEKGNHKVATYDNGVEVELSDEEKEEVK